MATKMLIDAAHPEETRVVVVRDGKVEEFDFEAASRRQLRGNIYLAKVTRVEPSLQAAFVDYGGNRHGFLAFSEIHPDYYQIPQADRQALIDEEEAESASEADESDGSETSAEDSGDEAESGGDGGSLVEVKGDESVESVGGDDALEEAGRRKSNRPRRNYKIQEVIKKRQIILVQVVKEERGNKGAALTTYLSLAGRYSVLMPNTARGGGISRKITSAADRKKLKEIATDLEVPAGMGVIVRTAGASRTKAEIKRDFEYLLRLWENVRELTLKSIAPTLVYEEGSLVKRAIRDLYTKDIEQVLVAGEQAYREAKDFMRMLMPSHAKNVQQYRDQDPIFTKNSVETQLDAMFSPVVTLRSGGYIVLNQTEALVSIDVNSGRSTREHNIEDTALKTNLEAADEVARQLRLRDLAGLDRHRLHRHGREAQQPLRREAAEGRAAQRPRPHPGRPHQPFRADGDVAAAHPHRRRRVEHDAVPALPRHRPCALDRIGGAARAALDRARAPEGQADRPRREVRPGRDALHPQPEARPPARHRAALRHHHHDGGRGARGPGRAATTSSAASRRACRCARPWSIPAAWRSTTSRSPPR